MSKAKKAEEFSKLDESRSPAVLRDNVPHKAAELADEKKRAARVLVSQGRASGLVEHLSDGQRKRLAALVNNDGTVQPAAPAEFQKILRELIDEHKAAVKGLEPNE